MPLHISWPICKIFHINSNTSACTSKAVVGPGTTGSANRGACFQLVSFKENLKMRLRKTWDFLRKTLFFFSSWKSLTDSYFCSFLLQTQIRFFLSINIHALIITAQLSWPQFEILSSLTAGRNLPFKWMHVIVPRAHNLTLLEKISTRTILI